MFTRVVALERFIRIGALYRVGATVRVSDIPNWWWGEGGGGVDLSVWGGGGGHTLTAAALLALGPPFKSTLDGATAASMHMY